MIGKLMLAKRGQQYNIIFIKDGKSLFVDNIVFESDFVSPSHISLDSFLRNKGQWAVLLSILEKYKNFNEVDITDFEIEPPLKDSNIICVGRNYAAHARELGNPVPGSPVLFMKSNSAIIGSGKDIIIPEDSVRVEHEGELVLVIGQDLMGHVDEETARNAIVGLTLLNDVTDRGKQAELKSKGKPWLPAKSRPTFAPCGPAIYLLEEDEDFQDFTIKTIVNGELRQEGNPSQWLWPAAKLVATISASIGLRAGDMIATGTPAGVGELRHGDNVQVICENIGTLSNNVIDLRTS